jgi:hypothetical protein
MTTKRTARTIAKPIEKSPSIRNTVSISTLALDLEKVLVGLDFMPCTADRWVVTAGRACTWVGTEWDRRTAGHSNLHRVEVVGAVREGRLARHTPGLIVDIVVANTRDIDLLSTDDGESLLAVLAIEVMGRAHDMLLHNAARTVLTTADISPSFDVTAITALASIGPVQDADLPLAIMTAHHDLQVTEVPAVHDSVGTEWPVENMAIVADHDRTWTADGADLTKVVASSHGHRSETKLAVAMVLVWQVHLPDADRSAHRWPSFNPDELSPG